MSSHSVRNWTNNDLGNSHNKILSSAISSVQNGGVFHGFGIINSRLENHHSNLDAVQLIQNEAVVSVAKVTEEFLAKLITQSYDQAKRLGRKTIKFEDIKAVVEKNSIQLGFLDEVFLRHDHHDQKQQLPQDDVVQDKMGQQEETNDDSKQNISSSTTAVAANTESSGPPPSI